MEYFAIVYSSNHCTHYTTTFIRRTQHYTSLTNLPVPRCFPVLEIDYVNARDVVRGVKHSIWTSGRDDRVFLSVRRICAFPGAVTILTPP